jgi:DNA-binding IclR family transcriptional regulator
MTTTPVSSSARLMMIVESFLDHPHQNLSQVSASCGLDPATSSRYLRALVERGWITHDPGTRQYGLGVRLVVIGEAARRSTPLHRRLSPHLMRLLAEFDETVNLAMRHGDDVVIIDSLESSRSLRMGASLGDRDDWFVSSLGKSILSCLPRQEVLRLLAKNPPTRMTPSTLMAEREILGDLQAARTRGYALDVEEAEIGLTCVGVPILDDEGRYTHALSVSGATGRMLPRMDDVVSSLRKVADEMARGRAEAFS